MRSTVRSVLAILLVLSVAAAAFAQHQHGRDPSRPGTGDTTGHYIAWKYLEPGVEPEKLPLVVEWLPASRAEIENSPLLNSKRLADYGGQCIGLQVVLPEDKARLDKLGLAAERPVALLVDGDGKILDRVNSEHGGLRLPAVEQMVQKELDRRGDAMLARLEEAKSKAAAGDKQAAIDVYQKVWDQRCLFPLFGHEAQRELKILGVAVGDPEKKPETQPLPSLNPKHEQKPPHERPAV